MDSTRFMDIRTHGFARVAIVVPRVHLADPAKNADAHAMLLADAYVRGAQYALCPELGLTGYSCGDLFHSSRLLDAAEAALSALISRAHSWPGMLISVGMPLLVDGAVYNCAVTLTEGRVLAVAPKAYPPEYREFYEGRHFARATEARCDAVSVCGQDAPFGPDILLSWERVPHFVLHTEVCEDLWVPIPPSTKAALAGATVLANLSASNITIGKSEYRKALVEASSARNVAVQLYSAAGAGESTTDMAWDGDGYIAERGRTLARTERFPKEGTMVLADIDLRSLVQDRMRQSSFRQNAADNRSAFRTVTVSDTGSDLRKDPYAGFEREIDAHPFVPSDPALRDVRCRETFMEQATSLVRRLETLRPEGRKVIIGVSGGQDSTHALNVAAYAMDLMGLPRTNIVGVTMPGFGTTDRTYKNACALIRAVGATFKEIPITSVATATFDDIGYDPATTPHDLTYENVQAWTRKHILFSVSSKEGGIVLGTGDLSEMLLGWCTYGGDHMSHYGINAGVPKTLISYLIAWTSDVIYAKELAVQTVLADILATPISPELLPPDEGGKIAQKTEDLNGPYELHDFFGYWTVRFGYPPVTVARLALHAFGGKYGIGEIKKWLTLFVTRFFKSQFKRSMLPDGPKIGLVAISPRGDWRMPSDASAAAWLADVERVPDTLKIKTPA